MRAGTGQRQMAFQLELMNRGPYLCYSITGAVTVENMKDLADPIREDSKRWNVPAVLLDCAGMKGALLLGLLFEVGEYYAEALPTIRLAAIHMPPYWKDNRFSEQVIQNRGGILRHFESEEEAAVWLTG